MQTYVDHTIDSRLSSFVENQAELPIEELTPFLTKGSEMGKSDVIHLAAGLVSLRLLNFLKMAHFYRIGKDINGKLFII